METIRDLNMDTDDMQVVLSAIHSVNRRIKAYSSFCRMILISMYPIAQIAG